MKAGWLGIMALLPVVTMAAPNDSGGVQASCDLSGVDDPALLHRLQALPEPAACRAWARIRALNVPRQDYPRLEIDAAGGIRYVDPAPSPPRESATP